MSRNLDVLTRKLTEYVNRFPLDDEWDEQCDQTLLDESDWFAPTGFGQGADLDETQWATGFVQGVLSMLMRDDPRFEQSTDELLTAILAAGECAVIPGDDYGDPPPGTMGCP